MPFGWKLIILQIVPMLGNMQLEMNNHTFRSSNMYTLKMLHDVSEDRKSAFSFLKRSKRGQQLGFQHELGPEMTVSNFQAKGMKAKTKFSFKIKELREVKSYANAWVHLPNGFDFSIQPSNGALVKKIVKGSGDEKDLALKLADLIMVDVESGKLRSKPSDDLMTVLFRYAMCRKKVNVYRNCPDPCNAKPCPNNNAGCRTYRDKSIVVNIVGAAKRFWAGMFQKNYECTCESGKLWNKKKKQCVKGELGSCRSLFGEKNPCRNGGTCQPSPKPGESFTCSCMPAYKGDTCELPLNPCRKRSQMCERFPCSRDPSNIYHGYTCDCTQESKVKGFQRYSDSQPRCVDINECKNSPCQRGGTCENTYGSYKCSCPPHWAGQMCQISTKGTPTWLDWGPPEKCSKTCGLEGIERQHRKCSQAGQCYAGVGVKERRCTNVPRHCPNDDVFDDSTGLVNGGSGPSGAAGNDAAYADVPVYDYGNTAGKPVTLTHNLYTGDLWDDLQPVKSS